MTMEEMTVATAIATALGAWESCQQTGNIEWEKRWEKRLDALDRILPSGSGLDVGCNVDRDKSTSRQIVLWTSYHHMTEGMYDGWTEHKILAWYDLACGLVVDVRGRDRNGIKDYLADVFGLALTETITWEEIDAEGDPS